MIEENRFRIIVCSDFEYEKLVVDLQYDYDQVAILSSDNGIENAEIRFYGIEPRILIFNFRVSEFIEFINKSFDEFKEITTHKAFNAEIRRCFSKNLQKSNRINRSSNFTNNNEFTSIHKLDDNDEELIFELYYGSLHFASLKHETNDTIEILIFDPNLSQEIWRFDCFEFIRGLKRAFEVLKSNE